MPWNNGPRQAGVHATRRRQPPHPGTRSDAPTGDLRAHNVRASASLALGAAIWRVLRLVSGHQARLAAVVQGPSDMRIPPPGDLGIPLRFQMQVGSRWLAVSPPRCGGVGPRHQDRVPAGTDRRVRRRVPSTLRGEQLKAAAKRQDRAATASASAAHTQTHRQAHTGECGGASSLEGAPASIKACLAVPCVRGHSNDDTLAPWARSRVDPTTARTAVTSAAHNWQGTKVGLQAEAEQRAAPPSAFSHALVKSRAAPDCSTAGRSQGLCPWHGENTKRCAAAPLDTSRTQSFKARIVTR